MSLYDDILHYNATGSSTGRTRVIKSINPDKLRAEHGDESYEIDYELYKSTLRNIDDINFLDNVGSFDRKSDDDNSKRTQSFKRRR